jgi:hypothetical protein
MKLFKHYLLLFILSFSALHAQEGFYYQAVIKNPDGSPLKEIQVKVKVSIVTNASTLYSEERSIQTTKEGFVSFIIGESDPSSFSNINWSQDLFLEDQIDINDGAGFSTPSRIPILKSPRAYVADRAINIYSKDGTLVLNSGDSVTKPTFSGNLLDSSGGTIIDNTAGSVTLSGNVTGDVTGTVSSLANQTTDALIEGSTNLYYTDDRARAAISGSTGVSIDNTTGTIAIGQAVGTTDDVAFNSVTATNLSGTITTTIQNSIGTMEGLTSVGSTTVPTTFNGPVVASEGIEGAIDNSVIGGNTPAAITGTTITGTTITATSGFVGNSDSATVATTTTITDNDTTDENNAIVFTPDGDQDGGDLGLESDKDLTYNPSTGTLSATVFNGALTGNVTGDVTGTVSDVSNILETSSITVAAGSSSNSTTFSFNPSAVLISPSRSYSKDDFSGNEVYYSYTVSDNGDGTYKLTINILFTSNNNAANLAEPVTFTYLVFK